MSRLCRILACAIYIFVPFTNAYVVDKSCDCYPFVKNAVKSAIDLAKDGLTMVEGAQKDSINSKDDTKAIKALSTLLLGSEDGLWAQGNGKTVKGQLTPINMSLKVDIHRDADRFEEIRMSPYTQREQTVAEAINLPGRTERYDGWLHDVIPQNFLINVERNQVTGDKTKKDADDCAIKNPQIGDRATSAFTYMTLWPDNLNIPKYPSQLYLCKWYLDRLQINGQHEMASLSTRFNQFRGKPEWVENIQNFFTKKYTKKQPEIERFQTLDQTILHELAHIPNLGQAHDIGKLCYGWRNCLAMAARPQDANMNADTIALMGQALWFVRNEICITKYGNLVASRQQKKECAALLPAPDDEAKKNDAKLKQAAEEDQGNSGVRVPLGQPGGGDQIERILKNIVVRWEEGEPLDT
ncbi:hypothetical protein BDV96DRAFT_661913 [Lophiotrema nucula]|uniref:Lysine-specific metallo-endopeptidase domain-containing protein n=1 Tax=Lophiotrema nucula TaxID=690887 RepID=A0A6A5Z3K9_9PLEO|nr:hypothetical protein BDV96DRAFT_661913 [Lophiotrema nucula]